MRKYLIAPVMFLLVACSTNPFETAQTLEQQAFALYGSYAIAANKAANISEDSATSIGIRKSILDALEATAPVARTMRDAAKEVSRAKLDIEKAELDGTVKTSLWQKLDVATGSLQRFYDKAEPQINSFIAKIGDL